MQIIEELLPGCFLIQAKGIEDQRGRFVKTYHADLSAELGINMVMQEEFYSMSHKDVVRGMHFQLPPHAHDKLVYCPHGAVLDVVLDIRLGTDYGRVASTELSGENGRLLFIPKGIAHGFMALTDAALMIYKTSTVHAPQADHGIRWDSFDFDWGPKLPILSLRDQQHGALNDFVSPF